MQLSPILRYTGSPKPRAPATRSDYRPIAFCRTRSANCSNARSGRHSLSVDGARHHPPGTGGNPVTTITHCPAAYAVGAHTQHGNPVSVSDRVALRLHARRQDWKAEAARDERMNRVKPWERSNRNRKVRP